MNLQPDRAVNVFPEPHMSAPQPSGKFDGYFDIRVELFDEFCHFAANDAIFEKSSAFNFRATYVPPLQFSKTHYDGAGDDTTVETMHIARVVRGVHHHGKDGGRFGEGEWDRVFFWFFNANVNGIYVFGGAKGKEGGGWWVGS